MPEFPDREPPSDSDNGDDTPIWGNTTGGDGTLGRKRKLNKKFGLRRKKINTPYKYPRRFRS
jgi:hypothetical protein